MKADQGEALARCSRAVEQVSATQRSAIATMGDTQLDDLGLERRQHPALRLEDA